jgi:hypothetical protein
MACSHMAAVHTRTTFTGSEASSSSHFIKLGTQAKQTFSLRPRSPTPMMSPRSTHSEDGACIVACCLTRRRAITNGRAVQTWARRRTCTCFNDRVRRWLQRRDRRPSVAADRARSSIMHAHVADLPRGPTDLGAATWWWVVAIELAEGFISY